MDEPEQLKRRPHWGKFPIPYVTAVIDGKPDFRTHDLTKRQKIAANHFCQLCGEKLGEEFVFIGFGHSAATATFGEPPMHRECLDWAYEACPWLAGGTYSDRWEKELGKITLAQRHNYDPESMAVYTTGDYELVPDPERVAPFIYHAGWATRPLEWLERGST